MQRYMICPWCHAEMECRDHNGVEIDQCPNCSGVWLDRGELETILSQSGERPASRDLAERPERGSLTPDIARPHLFEWF
jgi:Zn-finger nucleic acid-binding protein